MAILVTMTRMSHFVREWFSRWWLVILIYTGITFLSHQPKLPGPQGEAVEFIWFKTGHLAIYGFLGWSVCRALMLKQKKHLKRITWRLWVVVISIVAVLAILDEVHQMFIPGRGPHGRDVIIDLVGASVGVLWWYVQYEYLKNSGRKIELKRV